MAELILATQTYHRQYLFSNACNVLIKQFAKSTHSKFRQDVIPRLNVQQKCCTSHSINGQLDNILKKKLNQMLQSTRNIIWIVKSMKKCFLLLIFETKHWYLYIYQVNTCKQPFHNQ